MTATRDVPFEVDLGWGFWADGAGDLEIRLDGGYHGEEITQTVPAKALREVLSKAEHFWAAYDAYKVDYDPADFWTVYGE